MNSAIMNLLRESTHLDWKIVYDDETVLIMSNPIDYEDWTGVYFIECMYFYDESAENFSIHTSLYSVDIKPFETDREGLQDFVENMGVEGIDFDNESWDNLIPVIAESLFHYGQRARLAFETMEADDVDDVEECYDTTLKNLIERKTNCIQVAIGMVGFFLDMPQNPIGSTGWQFMNGDITSHLK